MSSPIKEDEFRLIKSKLEERAMFPDKDTRRITEVTGRSMAKISIIAACKDFVEYQRISKAEHPPVKNSLGDRVAELERWRKEEVDPYLSHLQRGRTQMAAELNRLGLDDHER